MSRTIRGSRAQAEQALARLAAEHGVRLNEPTVAEVLEAWYVWSKPRRQGRADAEVRRSLHNDLIPALGRLRLTALTTGDIEGTYQRLQHQRSLSGQSVRHLHFVLRPALRMAVRRGWRDDNPADRVELPPLKRAQVVPPVVADVRRLMMAVEHADAKLALFLRLLVATGTRRGEAAAFQWRDVDWSGRIHVVRALSEVTGGLVVKETKTARQRWVSLDAGTLARLEMARRGHLLVRSRNVTGWLFPGQRGGPIWPGAWSRKFIERRNQLGLTFRLHDLRHHHASVLLDEGVALQVVANRLGHARTSTTTDVYGHLLRADDGGAAAVVTSLYD